MIGWLNYIGHSHSSREVLKPDTWLRRRVRMCYWKAWKRPRPRRERLPALGPNLAEVHLATRTRKGYWRMSRNRIVQQALSNRWLRGRGIPIMKQQWIDALRIKRSLIRTVWNRPLRPRLQGGDGRFWRPSTRLATGPYTTKNPPEDSTS